MFDIGKSKLWETIRMVWGQNECSKWNSLESFVGLMSQDPRGLAAE
jgi:hypothetical protein